MDVAELSLPIEDFLGPFAGDAELAGKGAEELNDLSDVIVVLAILSAGLRIEEVVAGDKFKDLNQKSAKATISGAADAYHAGHTPDIGTRTPLGTENDFWRAVLSRLDVVGKVMPDPAGVAKISNLDGYQIYAV